MFSIKSTGFSMKTHIYDSQIRRVLAVVWIVVLWNGDDRGPAKFEFSIHNSSLWYEIHQFHSRRCQSESGFYLPRDEQSHHFSGAILHYLCIFNRKFKMKDSFYLPRDEVNERSVAPTELAIPATTGKLSFRDWLSTRNEVRCSGRSEVNLQPRPKGLLHLCEGYWLSWIAADYI